MRLFYFAPEIPGLSQTFVYREILALRRRGHDVIAMSVRRPGAVSEKDAATVGTVDVFYGRPFGDYLGAYVSSVFARPLAFAKVSLTVMVDFVASVLQGRATPALFYHYFTSFLLARIWRREGVDHVHVHFAHFPAQIVMYAAQFAHMPWTVTAHANDIYENGVLLREKARRADAMMTISEHNRQHLTSLGAPAAKLPVVRCGVAPPSAEATPPAHNDRPFRVGSLGRLVEKKGMATTIAAFAQLRAAGVDAELEIVGDGPLEDKLRALIDQHKLGDVVTLRGAMANDQALKWMQSLHCFCLACTRGAGGDVDGIPVALMEAMALGVPVISTRISGVPELVIDEQSGLLCDPDNPGQIAAALRRYYEDEALWETMRDGWRRMTADEFSEETNIARLEKIFEGAARS